MRYVWRVRGLARNWEGPNKGPEQRWGASPNPPISGPRRHWAHFRDPAFFRTYCYNEDTHVCFFEDVCPNNQWRCYQDRHPCTNPCPSSQYRSNSRPPDLVPLGWGVDGAHPIDAPTAVVLISTAILVPSPLIKFSQIRSFLSLFMRLCVARKLSFT